VLRDGRVTRLTPAEAEKRVAQALATYRDEVSRRHSVSAGSGNPGSSGTTTSTVKQTPLPGAAWVVGCYEPAAPGPS
jgi:hypothetical protein